MKEEIKDLTGIRALPERSVIQDADGQVWCVQHHPEFQNETWLSPFSDEYSVWIRADGTVVQPNNIRFPVTNLDVITAIGG
jgi:hypothetical protein